MQWSTATPPVSTPTATAVSGRGRGASRPLPPLWPPALGACSPCSKPKSLFEAVYWPPGTPMGRSLSHPPMARIDLPDGLSARVLSWGEVSEVLSRFDQLDPFGDGKPFWTLDREQSGQPLWAVVWGSKRNALF